ncbi:superoxide dismutase, partial [Nocardioides sp. NPDC057577]|uniref:superoxide dismutase n=1 Tax=Nocardioides sp. NPDC057577 TaxID=3346171 RepID=UPI00366DC974
MFRIRIALLAAALVAALVPATADAHTDFPKRFDLPPGFQPEGIAIGGGPTAWFGSRVDGDIYRVDLRTGRGKVVAQGPGTATVGVKVDRHGRLFAAGGPSGTARVIDTRTGHVLADHHLTTAASFVNDVVLTRHKAWFTDSQQAQLYAVPLGRGPVRTLPLTGDWEQVAGFNANGITATPDGRGLLVVNSTTGLLHRVDPRTGATTTVDLGGAGLTNGDGMLLLGRTLYVVRNFNNEIAVIHLDKSGSRGVQVDTLTSDDFDVPTTVAAYRDRLYLPNARFTTPPEPDTPYWVTA